MSWHPPPQTPPENICQLFAERLPGLPPNRAALTILREDALHKLCSLVLAGKYLPVRAGACAMSAWAACGGCFWGKQPSGSAWALFACWGS